MATCPIISSKTLAQTVFRTKRVSANCMLRDMWKIICLQDIVQNISNTRPIVHRHICLFPVLLVAKNVRLRGLFLSLEHAKWVCNGNGAAGTENGELTTS